jgi:dynein heavy chain
VPERVVKAMDKFQQENTDFTPENVKNSSKACYSLCKWCLAISNYAKVAKEIEPKKKMVEAMDAELKKAQAELQMKENKLKEEMKKVEDLERAYIEVKEKKERLENEIELCRQRLGRAEKLTNGLGSEHERWKENVQILDMRIRQLVGDVFIAAACISYYGPFTGIFREKLVQKWVDQCISMEIPTSDKFNMPLVMGDPMEI